MLHTSIQVRREHPGLPCAMALRLIRALPGDPAFLSPSPAGLTADLTPTLGRQDHTISPYAGLRIVTRSRRPPRPAPTSVTTADVPSWRDRMADILHTIRTSSRTNSVKSNNYFEIRNALRRPPPAPCGI